MSTGANKELLHIGIIMDGNRRWAKKRLLPVSAGHRAGAETLQKIIEHCIKINLKYLTVYAFSTENWKREKNEVNDLMDILREYLKKVKNENKDRNVRIKVIGDVKKLAPDLQKMIYDLEENSMYNKGLTLLIALNYGGRDEIIHAIKKITKELSKEEIENIDESTINSYIYTSEIPDPDLIIRTAGEKRLSNFLLWQSAYSEFWFTDTFWPDFSEKDLNNAIDEFNLRTRNFGGK